MDSALIDYVTNLERRGVNNGGHMRVHVAEAVATAAGHEGGRVSVQHGWVRLASQTGSRHACDFGGKSDAHFPRSGGNLCVLSYNTLSTPEGAVYFY